MDVTSSANRKAGSRAGRAVARSAATRHPRFAPAIDQQDVRQTQAAGQCIDLCPAFPVQTDEIRQPLADGLMGCKDGWRILIKFFKAKR